MSPTLSNQTTYFYYFHGDFSLPIPPVVLNSFCNAPTVKFDNEKNKIVDGKNEFTVDEFEKIISEKLKFNAEKGKMQYLHIDTFGEKCMIYYSHISPLLAYKDDWAKILELASKNFIGDVEKRVIQMFCAYQNTIDTTKCPIFKNFVLHHNKNSRERLFIVKHLTDEKNLIFVERKRYYIYADDQFFIPIPKLQMSHNSITTRPEDVDGIKFDRKNSLLISSGGEKVGIHDFEDEYFNYVGIQSKFSSCVSTCSIYGKKSVYLYLTNCPPIRVSVEMWNDINNIWKYASKKVAPEKFTEKINLKGKNFNAIVSELPRDAEISDNLNINMTYDENSGTIICTKIENPSKILAVAIKYPNIEKIIFWKQLDFFVYFTYDGEVHLIEKIPSDEDLEQIKKMAENNQYGRIWFLDKIYNSNFQISKLGEKMKIEFSEIYQFLYSPHICAIRTDRGVFLVASECPSADSPYIKNFVKGIKMVKKYPLRA